MNGASAISTHRDFTWRIFYYLVCLQITLPLFTNCLKYFCAKGFCLGNFKVARYDLMAFLVTQKRANNDKLDLNLKQFDSSGVK